MKKLVTAVFGVVFSLGVGTADALAQQAHSGLGFGVRGGFGLDPDQFVVGAQFSLGKTLQIFRVVPSVDVGFGDNVTTIDFNGDFLVRLIVEDTSFGFYGGGGPTVAYVDVDGGDSQWELGLSLVVGVQTPIIPRRATNIEARFGVGDIPDFRLLLAIIF
jgi:hypothetical protein